MTNKIIPNNSLCELNSTKPRSHTINNTQPLSLSSPPILTKKMYHITTKFPTNQLEQVYTTIETSISLSNDNHNSKFNQHNDNNYYYIHYHKYNHDYYQACNRNNTIMRLAYNYKHIRLIYIYIYIYSYYIYHCHFYHNNIIEIILKTFKSSVLFIIRCIQVSYFQ